MGEVTNHTPPRGSGGIYKKRHPYDKLRVSNTTEELMTAVLLRIVALNITKQPRHFIEDNMPTTNPNGRAWRPSALGAVLAMEGSEVPVRPHSLLTSARTAMLARHPFSGPAQLTNCAKVESQHEGTTTEVNEIKQATPAVLPTGA